MDVRLFTWCCSSQHSVLRRALLLQSACCIEKYFYFYFDKCVLRSISKNVSNKSYRTLFKMTVTFRVLGTYNIRFGFRVKQGLYIYFMLSDDINLRREGRVPANYLIPDAIETRSVVSDWNTRTVVFPLLKLCTRTPWSTLPALFDDRSIVWEASEGSDVRTFRKGGLVSNHIARVPVVACW